MTGCDEQLLDVIGHLGAALIQVAPSDDPIIVGHIREAHTKLTALRRSMNAEQFGEVRDVRTTPC